MNPRLPYNNPLSAATIAVAIERLDLAPSDCVLDVGCGNGEILRRVLDRYQCRGIGVDQKAEEIEAARHRLADHAHRVSLHESDIHGLDLGSERLHAALCIGSTHAFGVPGGAYIGALASLRQRVVPGGLLLIGEGFWAREPDEEYLRATGMSRHDFVSHYENVERAEAEGLIPLHATACSTTDWDSFESRFWFAAEDDLRRWPDDAEAQDRARHWRNWRRAFLRWGRSTLGFGRYLFRTPAPGRP